MRSGRNIAIIAVTLIIICACMFCTKKNSAVDSPVNVVHPQVWHGLEAGPYAVGFTIRRFHDKSRKFAWGNEIEAVRPIQVLVWYPAMRDSNAKPLNVRDYIYSSATEIDFEAPGAKQREQALQVVRGIITSEGVEPALFDKSILRTTLAVRDAVPFDGKYPLILYSPGMGASAYQNFVAMEYLASYGFITAAISSVGVHMREVEGSDADIETGVQDMEFAIEQLRSFSGVDADNIGVVGYSWGGLIVMFLAMRNPGINAVVSLDGSLMVKAHYEQARALPEYDPSKINQPALLFIANAKQWKARTLEFYEQLQGKDIYLAWFHDCFHGDFASTIIELVLHNLDDAGRDVTRIDTAYAWQCRYLRAFFEAYLKEKEESHRFLERTPEANNVPAGIIRGTGTHKFTPN
ncbi:MAG: hypothetical protein A2Y62_08135 [Candidatus Fischerbacteria bacterium RBG_13_37_8]|uniref:Dienelactone hydrolase domain-containing protein n=1 Tax=Candidatus Fischerbacteria bacterium RBG_13_37_8 TaxID=1817863 RepID=A0A1F5V8A2_9BACT|nr:MAG: hypothetical protein A2Y62_08135 [Candidatus Fischerbacteria bacterium RBG_13_37_8]